MINILEKIGVEVLKFIESVTPVVLGALTVAGIAAILSITLTALL
tara:strand:- start:866 stop:1000 length:135 start_codon:yes stop_codon:yes gene_type:complete